jgi:hypothetical protein
MRLSASDELVTWRPTPTSVAAARARTIGIDPVESMNSGPVASTTTDLTLAASGLADERPEALTASHVELAYEGDGGAAAVCST